MGIEMGFYQLSMADGDTDSCMTSVDSLYDIFTASFRPVRTGGGRGALPL